MARRSPQEKKQLSYAKDCRNTYGENDKASRKNLPRKRARVHRANRHRAHEYLHGATGPVDIVASDAAEVRLRGRRPKVFAKRSDLPARRIRPLEAQSTIDSLIGPEHTDFPQGAPGVQAL